MIVRRRNLSILIDTKEDATVTDLKRQISVLINRTPDEQMLLRDDTELMDGVNLSQYNITPITAKPQSPCVLGLCLKENGQFEALDITPYSTPPELPDSLKNTESTGGDQAN